MKSRVLTESSRNLMTKILAERDIGPFAGLDYEPGVRPVWSAFWQLRCSRSISGNDPGASFVAQPTGGFSPELMSGLLRRAVSMERDNGHPILRTPLSFEY